MDLYRIVKRTNIRSEQAMVAEDSSGSAGPDRDLCLWMLRDEHLL